MGMVDVTEKPVVIRQAIASGRILLAPSTVEEIRAGKIKKGDPLQVAEIAAMNAAKQTHLLIPHCHQIPLDTVQVTFQVGQDFVEVQCPCEMPGAHRSRDGSASWRFPWAGCHLGHGQVS